MKKLLVILIAFGLIFAGCPEPDPDAEYSVIYHGNNSTYGNVPIDNNKYKYGDKAVVLTKHTLGRIVDEIEYTFKNWNTKSDGSGDSYEPDDTIEITRTIFLHAMWNQLLTAQSRHGNVIVWLIEMRQEENIQQLEPVNGELFFNSQREHMNAH